MWRCILNARCNREQTYVGSFQPIDEEPMDVTITRDLPVSLDGEDLKRGTMVGLLMS